MRLSPPMTYMKDVTTLVLDKDKCVGCGMCTIVCPHGVLVLKDTRVDFAQRDACMECGACARNCPADAIFVEAGVGCAQAVINSALGRSGDQCCCVLHNSKGAGTGCC